MKHIYVLSVLLLLSIKGFSQDVEYGVRAGLNISSLDFTDQPPKENKHRNGLYMGFLARIGITNVVSIMPELQFSAEGSKDEDLQFDYIQMPILFRFKTGNKIHLGIGPQIGLKIDKVDDHARNMAYSAVGALEYRINYGLFADVRYTYGLVNVFDSDTGLDAKNSCIQIGIGYKF